MTDASDASDTDRLRERLQASDPARTLPPADPHRVARLLEDVMSTEQTTESRETGTRDRSPLTWLVAAAAVLVIAGVGLFGILNHDSGSQPPPVADRPTAGRTTVTELQAPGAEVYRSRCMVPSADLIATQSVAFDGTVTDLTGTTVTLKPSHWYAGAATDVVRVKAAPEAMQALVGAVDFEDGGRYLVSANHGQVSVCGLSAPYSARLAGLYEQAFGG